MSKISKKYLTYAVNFLNCQLNLNLKVKEQKGEFFIAPENEIDTLDNIYLSITKKDKNLVKNDYMILNKNYISNIKTTMLDGYYASYSAEIYTTYGAIINFDYEYSSDMDKIYSQLR